MKRGYTIALVVIVVVVLVIVVVNISQITGDATLTPNANYAPIRTHAQAFHSCVYLVEDDGWSVDRTTRIRYFDRLKGESVEVSDNCESDTRLTEYDCDNGFMVDRPVICPSRTVCESGSCIPA